MTFPSMIKNFLPTRKCCSIFSSMYILSVWVAGSYKLQSTSPIQRLSTYCVIAQNFLYHLNGFCRICFIKEEHCVNSRNFPLILLCKFDGFVYFFLNISLTCSTMNLIKQYYISYLVYTRQVCNQHISV